jgi:hypothetical protein
LYSKEFVSEGPLINGSIPTDASDTPIVKILRVSKDILFFWYVDSLSKLV